MRDFEYWYNLIDKDIKNLPLKGEPKNLYQPAQYLIELGGKRIRPALFLMANQIFSDKSEDFVQSALAFELFHNFTLVHDDLMDKSEIRRGEPTVHKKWNSSVAILSGDNMLITVYDLLLKLPESTRIQSMQLFNKMAHQLCEGQQMDMEFEQRKTVSEKEYIQMIEFKTSVLLGCAMQVGALVGGASLKDSELLYKSGLKIGLAFQIMDDYLDTFGKTAKVGKQIGGDIIIGKKTALYAKSLAILSGKDLDEFVQIYNDKSLKAEVKIESVKAIFTANKIDKLLIKDAEYLTQKAKSLLTDLTNPKVKPIMDVYDWLQKRVS